MNVQFEHPVFDSVFQLSFREDLNERFCGEAQE